MAATGTALIPGATTFPNTNVYPGQGEFPLPLVLYSTAAASANPAWTAVSPSKLRAFSTTRGRENELGDIEAGTAQVTVENQDRTFDPDFNSAIRPMNRWWIRSQFSGVTQDIIKGYAESYEQDYADGAGTGADALTHVRIVDEFKALALEHLPTPDPPRDTYQDAVMFDAPQAYWPLLYPNTLSAAAGDSLEVGDNNGASVTGSGPIVGQADPGYIYLTGTGYLQGPEMTFGSSGDAGALSEFAIETWLAIDGTPSATELLLSGPEGIPSHTFTWKLELNTSKQVVFSAKNSSGTTHTATSSGLTEGAIGPSNVWYHIVGTVEASFLRLYVNGTQVASTAWTGSVEQQDNAQHFIIGNAGVDIGSDVRAFDEVAWYRFGLTAARVLAHYTAGRSRGFGEQDPGARITAVLNAIGSTTPRNIRTGSREMTAAYMHGQSPLEEMRRAEQAEAVDAVLFIARDGTITFLDFAHRSQSPWNTTSATFDDGGAGAYYEDFAVDYTDSFLFNEFNITRAGGTTYTASDSASIATFKKRSQSVTDLAITDDAEQIVIGDELLLKYKNPLTRVSRLVLSTANAAAAEAALALDIGLRVRVVWTPPGGGSQFDENLYVQKISVDASNNSPAWRITLAVSPV